MGTHGPAEIPWKLIKGQKGCSPFTFYRNIPKKKEVQYSAFIAAWQDGKWVKASGTNPFRGNANAVKEYVAQVRGTTGFAVATDVPGVEKDPSGVGQLFYHEGNYDSRDLTGSDTGPAASDAGTAASDAGTAASDTGTAASGTQAPSDAQFSVWVFKAECKGDGAEWVKQPDRSGDYGATTATDYVNQVTGSSLTGPRRQTHPEFHRRIPTSIRRSSYTLRNRSATPPALIPPRRRLTRRRVIRRIIREGNERGRGVHGQ